MIKQLFLSLACMAVTAGHAQKTPVWQDPQVNQVNREARHAHFFAYENEDLARQADKAKSARFLSMEGKWKFNFVKDHQDAPEGFFALKYDDSKWTDFPVPGLFELNGYGDKIYKNIGYAWGTTFKSNPPYIDLQEHWLCLGNDLQEQSPVYRRDEQLHRFLPPYFRTAC